MTFTQFVPQRQLPTNTTAQLANNTQAALSPWNNSEAIAPESAITPILQHNNASPLSKKRRNIKLGLKGEPSDEKMRRISERRGSYKRSTNNSHKKFICVAKRILLRLLDPAARQFFEKSFQVFKNSRTYYFIILAHAKLLLPREKAVLFCRQFTLVMQNKIEFYRKEVERTDNRNFINFRCDEIADIEFALTALHLYFQQRVEEAIETIYKKDKVSVLKKHQFEQAIEVVKDLEARLRTSQNFASPPNQHEVIILQQHQPSLLSQLQHQEASEQQPHLTAPSFPHAFPQNSLLSCVDQNQHIDEDESKQFPMMFLEDSYPLYDYFYQIVFPYQVEQPTFQSFPFNYLYNYCSYSPLQPSFFTEPPQTLPPCSNTIGKAEEWLGKLGLNKTAADEDLESRCVVHH